jgi:peptidyl-tRNA hydrolase
MKKFVIYYNKKYDRGPGHLASQCAHAIAGLVSTSHIKYDPINDKVIVLGANNSKFHRLFDECEHPKHMQHDFEIPGIGDGEYTAFVYVEQV